MFFSLLKPFGRYCLLLAFFLALFLFLRKFAVPIVLRSIMSILKYRNSVRDFCVDINLFTYIEMYSVIDYWIWACVRTVCMFETKNWKMKKRSAEQISIHTQQDPNALSSLVQTIKQ